MANRVHASPATLNGLTCQTTENRLKPAEKNPGTSPCLVSNFTVWLKFRFEELNMKYSAAILIGCLAVFNTPLVRAQQPTMTDLVPREASYSLMFRNVNELKERGDEFAAEMGFVGGMSTLLSFVGGQLFVGKAADDNLPAGIMFFEPSLIDEPEVKQDWKKPVAVAVAISDTKKLAEALKVDHDEFVAGKTVERDHSAFGHKQRYYRMVGQYVWVVSHDKLYDVLKRAKPLTTAISRARLDAVNSADVLLSFSAESRNLQRVAAEEQAEKWIESHEGLDAVEKNAIREMYALMHSATHAIVTARVDRGLEFSFDIFWGKNAPPEVRQRIVKFSPPGDGVSLTGLPAGKLLFAHAARTDASVIQAAMTALARENRGFWWPGWQEMFDHNLVTQFEQLKLLGLFSEIWPLTNRYKVGIYQEENPVAHGLISMAAILETDQPEVLMNELQSLAALVDKSALGAVDNDQERTQNLVTSLILQLGDDNYQKRRSASTRLVLIGERALPLVIAAKMSTNAEVARRAVQIEKLIREELQEKRMSALKSSMLTKAKPGFIFHPDAEERLGSSVDIMEIRVQKNSELQVLCPILAGKDWSRIRLVKFEKHVVIFFGSDLQRLDELIQNVQSLEDGAELSAPEASYGSPLIDARGAEFQGSVARILRLMKGEHLTEKQRAESDDPDLSSLSVTVEPDFIAVEWRLSLPDLKAIRKQNF